MSNPVEPQRKSLFAPAANTPRSEMFPIRVESYDTTGAIHTVTGRRLDNGETATVSLRDIQLKPNAKFPRPTIAQFAAEREYKTDTGTTPGGVLLIEDATKVADGVYTSRWIRSLSHNAEEAEVMIVTAHCTGLRSSGGGKEYAAVTFLHDGLIDHLSQEMIDTLMLTSSGQVDTVADLNSALAEMLDAGIGAGVRIRMGDGFDGLYVQARKGVDNAKIIEDFIARIPQELKEAIDGGQAICEIIPYGTVWAGPATLEVMAKSATVQARMERYHDEKVGEKGKTYDVQLFRPSIVVMRMTKPDENGRRGVFVTHVEPLYTRQPVVGLREAICYAKSADFAPVPPKPDLLSTRAKEQDVANAPSSQPAPTEPQDTFGGAPLDYDQLGAHGQLSEEDVMGAAAGNFGSFEDFGEGSGADDIGDSAPRATRTRRMGAN